MYFINFLYRCCTKSKIKYPYKMVQHIFDARKYFFNVDKTILKSCRESCVGIFFFIVHTKQYRTFLWIQVHRKLIQDIVSFYICLSINFFQIEAFGIFSPRDRKLDKNPQCRRIGSSPRGKPLFYIWWLLSLKIYSIANSD